VTRSPFSIQSFDQRPSRNLQPTSRLFVVASPAAPQEVSWKRSVVPPSVRLPGWRWKCASRTRGSGPCTESVCRNRGLREVVWSVSSRAGYWPPKFGPAGSVRPRSISRRLQRLRSPKSVRRSGPHCEPTLESRTGLDGGWTGIGPPTPASVRSGGEVWGSVSKLKWAARGLREPGSGCSAHPSGPRSAARLRVERMCAESSTRLNCACAPDLAASVVESSVARSRRTGVDMIPSV